MLYKDLFFSIHWLAVAVVTMLALLVTLAWNRFVRPREEEGDAAPKPVVGRWNARNVALTLLLYLLAFANLSLVVAGQGVGAGALTGAAIGIVWVFPALATSTLFSGRSWRLLARDGGLYLLLYALGGLTLGRW
jgi:Na+/H+ antiporter NhaD/arsenite permease-like protein